MNALHAALLVIWPLAMAIAEQAPSPLGQLVRPTEKLAIPEAKLFPPSAIVRARIPLGPSPDAPVAVVYDLAPRVRGEYNPHVGIVEGSRVSARFDLTKSDEYAESAVFVQGAPLRIADSTVGFVGAFRNAGDGAACLFAIVVRSGPDWRLAFFKRTSQANLEVLEHGKVLKLRFATNPGSRDCTWCPHQYKEESLSFDEKDGQYKSSGTIALRRRLDPVEVVKQLLVVRE